MAGTWPWLVSRKKIMVLDRVTRKELFQLASEYEHVKHSLAFSPDGKHLRTFVDLGHSVQKAAVSGRDTTAFRTSRLLSERVGSGHFTC